MGRWDQIEQFLANISLQNSFKRVISKSYTFGQFFLHSIRLTNLLVEMISCSETVTTPVRLVSSTGHTMSPTLILDKKQNKNTPHLFLSNVLFHFERMRISTRKNSEIQWINGQLSAQKNWFCGVHKRSITWEHRPQWLEETHWQSFSWLQKIEQYRRHSSAQRLPPLWQAWCSVRRQTVWHCLWFIGNTQLFHLCTLVLVGLTLAATLMPASIPPTLTLPTITSRSGT